MMMMMKSPWVLLPCLFLTILDITIEHRAQGNTTRCPKLQELKSMDITISGWNVNDTAKFHCPPDHLYVGTNPRKCQPDGTWSGTKGECQVTECQRIPEPDHGSLVTYKNEGQTVEVICDEGYTLEEGPQKVVCWDNNKWSDKLGTCTEKAREVCKDPEVGEHVSVDYEEYARDMAILLHCKRGYIFKGEKKATCLKNGTWTSINATCEEKRRDALPSVNHGEAQLLDGRYPDIAEIRCQPGYLLDGAKTISCRKDGSWTEPGNCIQLTCPGVPKSKHTHLFLTSMIDKELTVEVECDDGYTWRGPEQLVCKANNRWSAKFEPCIEKSKVKCGVPATRKNVRVDYERYAPDLDIRLYCGRGYNFKGRQKATCQENGKWTSINAACEARKCGKPPTIVDASIYGVGSSYKDTVEIRCPTGFKLSGPDKMTCQHDGTWSKPGKCTRQEESPNTMLIVSVLSGVIVVITLAAFILILRRRAQPRWEPEEDNRDNEDKEVTVEELPPDPLELLNDANRSTVKRLLIAAHRVQVGEVIGQGHYGIVYVGTLKKDDTGAEVEVALKTLKGGPSTDPRELNNFIQEATIMQDFDHPNVLPLLGITVIKGQIYVVLPCMRAENLKEYVKTNPFDRGLYLKLLLEAARGMEYLAKRNFVHRDVAARNCMLNKALTLFIGDFGLTRDLNAKDYYTPADTTKPIPLKWMAPETLENFLYTTQSDIWSFAVMMWEVLSGGGTPYSDINAADVLHFLKNGYRLPQPAGCPTALYHLLLDCWAIDPYHRPTFTMIASSLEYIIDHIDELDPPVPAVPQKGADSGAAGGGGAGGAGGPEGGRPTNIYSTGGGVPLLKGTGYKRVPAPVPVPFLRPRGHGKASVAAPSQASGQTTSNVSGDTAATADVRAKPTAPTYNLLRPRSTPDHGREGVTSAVQEPLYINVPSSGNMPAVNQDDAPPSSPSSSEGSEYYVVQNAKPDKRKSVPATSSKHGPVMNPVTAGHDKEPAASGSKPSDTLDVKEAGETREAGTKESAMKHDSKVMSGSLTEWGEYVPMQSDSHKVPEGKDNSKDLLHCVEDTEEKDLNLETSPDTGESEEDIVIDIDSVSPEDTVETVTDSSNNDGGKDEEVQHLNPSPGGLS